MDKHTQLKKLTIRCLSVCLCLMLSSGSWSFDPTAPPGAQSVQTPSAQPSNITKVKKPGFILRQIVINGENKSAVINGYIVNEGSYINNALVKAINKETVKLSLAGKTKILRLQTRLPKIRR